MNNLRYKTLLLASVLLLAGCQARHGGLIDPVMLTGNLDLRINAQQEAGYEKELLESNDIVLRARALFMLGQASYLRADWSTAGRYFQRCTIEYPGTGWDKLSLWKMAATLEQLGSGAKAFVQYQKLIQDPGFGNLPEKARAACKRISSELDEINLRKVISFPAIEELQPALRFSLLEKIKTRGDVEALTAGVEQFLSLYPESEYAERVEAFTREVFESVPVNSKLIGVIMPQEGSQVRYGNKILSGLRMALDEVNAGLIDEDKWQIVVANEGGTTLAAQAAAQKLVEEDQVMAIIGPLLSDSAHAIAAYCSSRRVPVISPSASREGLTEIGSYFFRNCITPQKQGRVMADHALLDMRVTRVATLWPDTWYGRSMSVAFEDRFVELGGSVPASVSYVAGATDYKRTMMELGGVDPGLAKDEEVEGRKRLTAKIEEASLRLAKHILAMKPVSSAAHVEASVKGGDGKAPWEFTEEEGAAGEEVEEDIGEIANASLVFPVRVAVVDFASTTTAAKFETSRGLSDRFRRTMNQAEDIAALNPSLAGQWMIDHGMDETALDIHSASQLARDLGAQMLLGGTVQEVYPNIEVLEDQARQPGSRGREARRELALFTQYQVFQVTVHLLDARSGSITAFEEFDFKKLKESTTNPFELQALFVPSSANEAGLIAPNLDFFDLRVPLLGGDAWHQRKLLRHADALDGARFTTGFDPESDNEITRKFVENYKVRYAQVPGTLEAQGYDAMGILLQASAGAENREQVKKGLLEICNFKGATGKICFRGRRDAIVQVPVLQIKNGDWVRLR